MGRITSLVVVFVMALALSTTGFAQGWRSSNRDSESTSSNTKSKTTSTNAGKSSKGMTDPITLKALGRMTKTLADAKREKEAAKKQESGRSSRSSRY
jgi:hypothetical protein